MTTQLRSKVLIVALAIAAWLTPGLAFAQSDTILFSTYVQPNVLLLLDNSESMNEIAWHPDFDPNAIYDCQFYPREELFLFSGATDVTQCGKTRKIYIDNRISLDTAYRGKYLNWLFSDASDAAYAEISQSNNGSPSSCVGGADFPKYQLSKLSAAKLALQDIVCEVNEIVGVRFGVMVFREPSDATDDSNGGYVIEPIDDYSSAQAADLDSAFQAIDAETQTPIAEALFQGYTYFMSRTLADVPKGLDGNRFPLYQYSTSTSGTGGKFLATMAQVPVSPVQYACQKNFVIIVTDGDPTFDDFQVADPADTANGFGDFGGLVGDYNPDGETEFQNDLVCTDCQTALYLDDLAYYMQTKDFRPDFDGDQIIDTYTIGWTTSPRADELLYKTAQLGNGIFFRANNAQQMAAAIVDAFSDIIEKAQSFTAATVPATRTSEGEGLYVSLFVPSEKTPYWEGHLRRFEITPAGEIYDKNGVCALDDPTPGECFSGPFKSTAEPFWDTFTAIGSPGGRTNLTVSKLVAGVSTEVPFDTTLLPIDLGVVFPSVEVYPESTALTDVGLTGEIVQNVRGCEFGTGVLSPLDVAVPTPCVTRRSVQSDIFHSNPVVIGQPALFDSDPSYKQFALNLNDRDRVIIAGSNGGFLQGFDAGTWQAAAVPPGYDEGTGKEVFGFMPWPARQNIRHKPIDKGNRDYYMVDGSPVVSDAWLYTNPTTAPKLANGSEWKTVLVSGMRQGGPTYFALDISDPSAAGYPDYMWEFPAENAPASLSQYFGETWGEPVLTRVKVAVGGNDNGGEGFERWVMVVTGGFDTSGDPNNVAAYDKTATQGRGIFMVDVKTGEVLAQQVFMPLAVAGDPRAEMRFAIASAPAVYDLDRDGFADSIYVGDLGGNVWKWVVHGIGEDRVNDGGSPDSQPNWPFRRILQAPVGTSPQSSADHYKSFFFPPAALYKDGTLWVVLGSGERANTSYEGLVDNNGDVINTTEDNNRFYAFKEPDPYETQMPPLPTVTEANLKDLSADSSTCADLSAYRGYYFVARDAEKFVTNIEIFVGYVFIGSYIPTKPLDPCDLGGEAGLYVFRAHCGEGFFPTSPVTRDRNIALGQGLPTDPRITVGNGGDSTNRVIINKQGGEIINFEAPEGYSGHGLYYWRELTR